MSSGQQTRLIVQVVPAVATLVADPPLIDMRILPGLQPIDRVLIVLSGDGTTACAAAANIGLAFQKPNALLVEEIFIPQRPHGTEIHNVSRKFIVERIAWKNVDFLFRTAIDHHQLTRARNLAGKSHAARAHHAAVDEERDGGADIAAAAREWMQIGTTLSLAVLKMIILQQALTSFVADGTIDRVIDQQRLFDARPAFLHQRAGGDNHRAILGWRLTGRH